MAQLQVGDKVYIDNKWSESIVTIDRVTDKRAFCGKMQFYREYENHVRKVGVVKWDTTTCKIATAEIISDMKYRSAKARAIKAVKDANINHLTLDQLTAILNIIKPQTNGTI